ncbi:MAG: proton-conducting transporter membrane subunit [Gemmatimonas sp.]
MIGAEAMASINALLTAPWEALAFCLLLIVAPAVAEPLHRRWHLPSLIAALLVTLLTSNGAIAYVAVAIGAVVHAWGAWQASRTGAVMLVASAVLALAVAVALQLDQLTLAFGLSCVTVAMRAGVMPLHIGVASLCDRAPVVQTQQLASTVALVFIHLRFVDHHAAAIAAGPTLVRYGAVAAVLAALMTLVQKDLRGFYRGTTAMHGGMLFAAIGAASIGNFAAALLVAVSMGLALGGLGMMITSLEERVGPVMFRGPGGRIGAFPKLAGAFILFGGAGVGLPGTAGFVADDLLLHTLWMESPTSTVVIILSSAMVAVATLITFSKTFLGKTVASLAPDLYPRERAVALTLLLLLLLLGFAPGVLLGPADAFLTAVPT